LPNKDLGKGKEETRIDSRTSGKEGGTRKGLVKKGEGETNSTSHRAQCQDPLGGKGKTVSDPMDAQRAVERKGAADITSKEAVRKREGETHGTPYVPRYQTLRELRGGGRRDNPNHPWGQKEAHRKHKNGNAK